MEEETTNGQSQTPEGEGDKDAPENAVPLTDDALAFAGLQKVTAYVRVEQSGSAKRKQHSWEKSEQRGVKQLNLQLPVEVHQVFRDIAQELQRTNDLTKTLQNVLAKFTAPAEPSASKLTVPAESPEIKNETLKFWQLWVARLLHLIRF